jgi:hypothetical protein
MASRLAYDPDTGAITRRSHPGKSAVTFHPGLKSAVVYGGDYRQFPAHHVAWYLHTGHWPADGTHVRFAEKSDPLTVADFRAANLYLDDPIAPSTASVSEVLRLQKEIERRRAMREDSPSIGVEASYATEMEQIRRSLLFSKKQILDALTGGALLDTPIDDDVVAQSARPIISDARNRLVKAQGWPEAVVAVLGTPPPGSTILDLIELQDKLVLGLNPDLRGADIETLRDALHPVSSPLFD